MEVHAEALELDLVPADADAQPEAALAQRVERGGLLGDQRRLALRQDQHAGGEADLLRDARQEAEQHERIVIGGGVRAALAGRDLVGIDAEHMVGRDEIVEAQPFGGLRIVAHHGRAGAEIADGDGCSELHRCLPSTLSFIRIRYSAAALRRRLEVLRIAQVHRRVGLERALEVELLGDLADRREDLGAHQPDAGERSPPG